jgi:branched-chain amino acid transport system substrate-binding protein
MIGRLGSSATGSCPAIAVAVGLLLLTVGCERRTEIPIAVVLPLSGPDARCGRAIRAGAELARDELAEAIGVELRIEDSAGDPRRAAALLESLYDAGAVGALAGVRPDESRRLAAVAESERRVLLSPSPVWFDVGADARRLFRLAPAMQQEASTLAGFVRDTLGLLELVVAADGSQRAEAERAAVERAFIGRGGRVVDGAALAKAGGADGSLIEVLASGSSQAVLQLGEPEAVLAAVERLRTAGWGGRILTTSSFALSAASGAAASDAPRSGVEGVLFPRPAFDPTADGERLQRFVVAFRARHGRDPDLCAVNGYDGAALLVEAVRRGGPSPDGVYKGLRGIRDFAGMRHAIQFDERGEVLDFPRIHRFEGGELVDHESWLEERRRELEERLRELARRRAELVLEAGGG